jgi:hypothetical protein
VVGVGNCGIDGTDALDCASALKVFFEVGFGTEIRDILKNHRVNRKYKQSFFHKKPLS